MTFPHFGHLAFRPRALAGALSLFPQAHSMLMESPICVTAARLKMRHSF